MKKVFGIILLIVGLLIVNIGVGGIVHTTTEKECLDRQFLEHLDIGSRQNSESEMVAGFAFVFVGLLFFIIGIVLTTSKTKKQREIEMELSVLKKMQDKNSIN